MCLSPGFKRRKLPRRIATILMILGLPSVAADLMAQDTPLLSGGVGFFTNTTGGSTSSQPILTPVLAAPIGQHLLVESRANVVETFSPEGNDHGYNHSTFLGLSYLQGDYIANAHATLVGGYFL